MSCYLRFESVIFVGRKYRSRKADEKMKVLLNSFIRDFSCIEIS